MPPDLFGNMHASSAWMLFCSAPKRIDALHRATAPPVPSAPIDDPNAAIRKPGFASATTKPSHHVMALRSCLSSTSAYATGPLSPRRLPKQPALVPIGTGPAAIFYHSARTPSIGPPGARHWTAGSLRGRKPLCTSLYEDVI